MKIHLGCGHKRITGWNHVDARPLGNVDTVARASELPFLDNSAELIYACHVLEHVGRNEVFKTLREWKRVLKHKGILRIAVPDFAALCNLYQQTFDIGLVIGPLYGRQDYKENSHKVAFDFDSLSNALVDAGFSNIERYDWRKTEHADLDDYSQSYYPHMDKDNGLLLSLNVEATA